MNQVVEDEEEGRLWVEVKSFQVTTFTISTISRTVLGLSSRQKKNKETLDVE